MDQSKVEADADKSQESMGALHLRGLLKNNWATRATEKIISYIFVMSTLLFFKFSCIFRILMSFMKLKRNF